MADAISVTRDGRRTFLKWHRARRRAGDTPFTGRRIVEGLRLGASAEVDLVVHGEGGFAVLHDLVLDRDTTGTGPVRAASAATLRALHLRGADGAPLPDRVMLIEDLCELMSCEGAHPEGLLQLDFKEDQVLDAGTIAAFHRIVAPVARHFVLSSGDVEAVRRLSEGVDGLRIGHDPCHFGAIERLRETSDFTSFVEGALADAPQAEMIYLHHGLVLAASDQGVDLVAAFQAAGRRVDAYTIRQADAEGVETARRLLDLRVDQITTDDPEGLGAALA
ncbi:Glycerophosphoryl diester phosphodiesterase [Rubellimicrobium mesophilum DSM 19309]|uniref:Glycerophosphoryl diester phosphodiesterase n=1 Tax=Rubellimicrobium mesophilum DSM 19309 TaxID=442562 RepID=A0A017HQC9_9RHOB|nr:glycerophosphodiester phosphodiesterase family protein [Rubellimicrobium mesophilum]EYD75974.1 Glycerophosphoryl diester phosphodiesterase [Rubellimicrobium mesophilum DSM 19309]